MDSLRWILLGLGVLVIGGVYLWTRWQSVREDRQYGSMLSRELDADPLIDTRSGTPADEIEAIDEALNMLDKAVYEDVSPDPAIEDFGAEPALQTEPESSQDSANGAGFSAADERLLILYLVANQGTPFQGKALRESFGQVGLEFGEMDIYHRKSRSGAPVFSVANLVEPGTFDQVTMDSSETRGISLFMRLPGPVPSVNAFDDFSTTARELVDQLGGELRDESRGIFTEQSMERIRKSLVEFERNQQVV